MDILDLTRNMGNVERSIGYSLAMMDLLEAIHELPPQIKCDILAYINEKRELRKLTDYSPFESDLPTEL